LETQHYFHAQNGGERFKDALSLCSELFDKIEEFAFSTKLNIVDTNVLVTNNGLIGEIDMIEKLGPDNVIWEIKCASDISLKHILQVVMYNILYHNITAAQTEQIINANFINFLKGEMINMKIVLSPEKIKRMMEIFSL